MEHPIFVFTVVPGGPSCPTNGNGELVEVFDTAYFKAHLAAARQAAETRSAAWVIRNDTGDERYGFGATAAFTPTTVLYHILTMGLGSYWDDASTSWVPLDLDEASVETRVLVEA